MPNIDLHCYILGDATDKIFTLSIPSDASVSSLRSLVARTIQLNPTQFNLFSVPLSRQPNAQRKTRSALDRIETFVDLAKTADQQDGYGVKVDSSGRMGAPTDVIATQLRIVWLKRPADKVAAVFDLEEPPNSSVAVDLVIALDLATYFHVSQPQQQEAFGPVAPPAYDADGSTAPLQDQKRTAVEPLPHPGLFIENVGENHQLSSVGNVEYGNLDLAAKPVYMVGKTSVPKRNVLFGASIFGLSLALIIELSASFVNWMRIDRLPIIMYWKPFLAQRCIYGICVPESPCLSSPIVARCSLFITFSVFLVLSNVFLFVVLAAISFFAWRTKKLSVSVLVLGIVAGVVVVGLTLVMAVTKLIGPTVDRDDPVLEGGFWMHLVVTVLYSGIMGTLWMRRRDVV
ncbi:hypothetical protein HDU97_008967 [Phlyctochytrium planicorne]|nr:hypothetical protein HDU97_008967 [Phlyctochytrium planicorne]